MEHLRPAPGSHTTVLPCTDTERALVEIWCAVLDVDGVRRDDDFLELGGDSLAAMRCINRISARFAVELPLDLFFMEPASIAGIASHLERLRSEATQQR